jgi:hypothetical protein
LEESLLTLEAMPADGTRRMHAQATGKHSPVEAHGAALCDDGAQSRCYGHILLVNLNEPLLDPVKR